MARVFISHATQDDSVAEKIYESLLESGIRAWLDNVDIDPQTDWLKQVDTAVKESSHGLFLLSPASLRSPAAIKEFRRLMSEGKPLYVALIADVDEDDLPSALGDIPYFNLTDDFDRGLQRLIDAMQSGGGAPSTFQNEPRDITITLQANLRDLDTDKLVELIARLADMGIRDIKVVNIQSDV
jgi:hypothetical protein